MKISIKNVFKEYVKYLLVVIIAILFGINLDIIILAFLALIMTFLTVEIKE